MKKFVIERHLPGASNLSAEELQAMSQTSIEVAGKMDEPYIWIQSFVTGDKIYCIHIAESEASVRRHSKSCDFPVNTISEVAIVIDPLTANPL